MSVVPVFQKILRWGGLLALAIAIIGGGIGYLVEDVPGLVSALLGTAMSILFMGITAGTILLALRISSDPSDIGTFFGVVMGGWLVKFVAFFFIVFALKDQLWLQPIVLFIAIVVGVLGSLIIDVVVIAKSRVSYVSDVTLPTEMVDED